MVALLYYINVNVKVKQWYRYILEIPTIDPQQEIEIVKVHPMGIYTKQFGRKQLCNTCNTFNSNKLYRYVLEIPKIDPQQEIEIIKVHPNGYLIKQPI